MKVKNTIYCGSYYCKGDKMEITKELLKKVRGPALDDDYPVYVGYIYLADNKVIRSPLKGTIGDLRDAFEEGKQPVTFFNGIKYDPEIDYLFI